MERVQEIKSHAQVKAAAVDDEEDGVLMEIKHPPPEWTS